MAGRDLTAGELEVKLDGISDQLKVISENMLTKGVFDVWNHGIDQRFVRTEDRQREIEKSFATLRSEFAAELEKVKTDLTADLKQIRKDREDDKQDIENFKRSRFNSLLILILGVPVAVVTTGITIFLWPR